MSLHTQLISYTRLASQIIIDTFVLERHMESSYKHGSYTAWGDIDETENLIAVHDQQ
jgi:hypothetical protein